MALTPIHLDSGIYNLQRQKSAIEGGHVDPVSSMSLKPLAQLGDDERIRETTCGPPAPSSSVTPVLLFPLFLCVPISLFLSLLPSDATGIESAISQYLFMPFF